MTDGNVVPIAIVADAPSPLMTGVRDHRTPDAERAGQDARDHARGDGQDVA